MIDFTIDPAFQEKLDWTDSFVRREVLPLETLDLTEAQWRRLTDPLKSEVRSQGLWAPHLPRELGGGGWTLVEQGLLYEIIGISDLAQQVFGNQAPDSGNAMMLFAGASDEQKERWLRPLLAGEIRSAFSMTEPATAGSDAISLAATARRDGDEWVLNGHKWFTSNGSFADILLVVAKTEEDARPHDAFSVIVVPANTPGVNIVRNITSMSDPEGIVRPGYHSHAEIIYQDVRVPLSNTVGLPGEGFALAQARLGPARIHRCMEWLGKARRAYDMMCERAVSREAFGSTLGEKQSVQTWIADVGASIESARLLTLYTAWKVEKLGVRESRSEISMIKYVVPRVLFDAVDRAIQVHGSLGFSGDMPLEYMYRDARNAPIVDGPDEVHRMTVAKQVLRRYEPRQIPTEHIPTRREAARDRFADVLHGSLEHF